MAYSSTPQSDSSLERHNSPPCSKSAETWFSALFPPGVSARRPRAIAVAVITIALLICLSLSRVAGAGALNTIWAEDGRVFYGDSLRMSPARALMTPYNGYLHFVPRLLAEISRCVPLNYLSAFFSVSGAFATSLLALFVWVASGPLLKRFTLRILVAAPIASTWVAQSELGNNAVDLQWYFLYAAFWAVVWNIGSRSGRVVAASIVFLSVASDPLTLLYFPLLLMRVRVLRQRRDWILIFGTMLGALYQGYGIVFMKSLSSRPIEKRYDPIWSAWGYVLNVLGRAFWSGPGHQAVSIVLACALAGVIFTFPSEARRHPLAITAIAFSVALYGALTFNGGIIAGRYAAPSSALLIAGVAGVATAEASPVNKGVLMQRHLEKVLCVLVAACVGFGFAWGPDAQSRGESRSWSGQLDQAEKECFNSDFSFAVLEIAPSNHGWSMNVPCELVLHRKDWFQTGIYAPRRLGR